MTTTLLKLCLLLFSTQCFFIKTSNAQDICTEKIPECQAKFDEFYVDIHENSGNIRDVKSEIRQLNSRIATLKQTVEMPTMRSGYKYNIAKGKPTNQSSVLHGADSSKAVDDVWKSHLYSGSCSATLKEWSPWWYVELQDRYTIYSVVIQVSEYELNGARILVGDSLKPKKMHTCGTFSGSSGEIREIKCFPPVTGRYLKIQVPGLQHLDLCEVAVYDAFRHD